jgi:hypothetical protein
VFSDQHHCENPARTENPVAFGNGGRLIVKTIHGPEVREDHVTACVFHGGQIRAPDAGRVHVPAPDFVRRDSQHGARGITTENVKTPLREGDDILTGAASIVDDDGPGRQVRKEQCIDPRP